jgi:hypothetical protein
MLEVSVSVAPFMMSNISPVARLVADMTYTVSVSGLTATSPAAPSGEGFAMVATTWSVEPSITYTSLWVET